MSIQADGRPWTCHGMTVNDHRCPWHANIIAMDDHGLHMAIYYIAPNVDGIAIA